MSNKFEDYLGRFGEQDWLAAVEKIAPAIHEVDRAATQIWFRFYPLALFLFLEAAEDRDKAIQKFVIQGDFELKTQIDTSHKFLYGHRLWKESKTAIEHFSDSFSDETAGLAETIEAVAATVKGDKALTLGITAVGLMTLRQVGLNDFKAAAGTVDQPKGSFTNAPSGIVADRAKDDSQGIFGFLKTVDKKYTATWDETSSNGSFRIISDEDVATASARDHSQDWKSKDERCWEGVVPVECRSAACGTCWVGVLGGQEKLSEVQRLERKQMTVFGYNQPDEPQPFLRLACQAKTSGNVTFVIPPWNGVFGKAIYGVEDRELKPATTSAKKLRETFAVSGSAGEQ